MIKNISERLIISAQEGCNEAIIALLESCQPDLRRFARKVCSSTEDAEDAVQAALWTLYRKIGTLKKITALAAWLFRIVERECYLIFRKKNQQVTENTLLDVYDENSVTELRIDLSRAIAELPPEYRSVLILRDIQSLTTPEVAAELGLSVEAVKSRLHRARNKVREWLLSKGYRP